MHRVGGCEGVCIEWVGVKECVQLNLWYLAINVFSVLLCLA